MAFGAYQNVCAADNSIRLDERRDVKMAGPRFSILIPTRNGLGYLKYAIDSVLSQSSKAFELVISDNHSTDGTAEYLATISDVRLRHVRPPRLLSMSDHFEYLLAEARGEWITALGDDDGLLPFFFDWLEQADINVLEIDALVFRRAYYFWDGCEELYGNRVVAYLPSSKRKPRSNRLAMFLCLASVIDYMHLPQLYTTGLIKRTYVDKIKAATGGRFFYGRSPDASSVAALGLHAPRHYRFEQPLFWTGTSPKSTGFSGGSTKHKMRIKEFEELDLKGSLGTTAVVPPAIRSLFDLAVIFYDALLTNPATSRFWSSRIARDCFLAGLIIKNSKNLEIIRESYGARVSMLELRASIMAVKTLARLLKWTGYCVSASEPSASLYSEQRELFPTMAEASARVHAIDLG